ncbi:MAG: hypothetical protein Q9196_002303 [Gyalolechia fulgens]
MPHLLSLPRELSHRIIDLICPDDLVSFISANKAIYALSEARIQKHQAMVQQYSCVRMGESSCWNLDGAEITHRYPLLFLKELLEDPHLAFYPTSLHIAKWGFEADHQSQTDLSCAPDLAALLTKTPGFQGEARLKTWRDALLEPTNYVHHIAILLTLLHNVETITIISLSHRDSGSGPIREIVWVIGGPNQVLASKLHGKALGKLRQLSLEAEDMGYHQDLTFFLPFAALPPMLSGVHWCGQPTQGEIRLEGTSLENNGWKLMLERTMNLKTFICHDWGWTYGGADILFSDIIALLAAHASHSLETLHLIADPYLRADPNVHDNENSSKDIPERLADVEGMPEQLVEQFMEFGKLREFRKFQDLRLDGVAFKIGKV